MADSLPIPKPPGSPDPPSDDDAPRGLGLDGVESYNPNTLSPYSENFGAQSLPQMSNEQAAAGTLSPQSINAPPSPEKKGPFNFRSQPMDLTKSPVTRSVCGLQKSKEAGLNIRLM